MRNEMKVKFFDTKDVIPSSILIIGILVVSHSPILPEKYVLLSKITIELLISTIFC